ncbi:MAG: tetraacyldisaccharide 4-kinase [Pseudomonadota bacterium]|jgi:tetraacyldisaccharide-1-P 4'-kinase
MSLAWTEYLRTQIERPLLRRDFWFAALSVFFLFPLSLLWSVLASVRARRRRVLPAPQSLEPWILSIGNVSVGGTGKSPVVRAIARLALSSGFNVAVFTRGVGRKQHEPFLLHLNSSSQSLSEQAWNSLSDETLEHALQLQVALPQGAQLWFAQGAQRSELFKRLMREREAQQSLPFAGNNRPLVVLVDDGLQQTSLPVHRDVVVWDPQSLLSAPRCALPFGPYRQGWPLIQRWAQTLPVADVLVWSRMRSRAESAAFEKQVKAAAALLLGGSVHTGMRQSGVDDVTAEPNVQCSAVENIWLCRAFSREPASGFGLEAVGLETMPAELNLLCGIARPDRFEKSFVGLCEQVGHFPQILRVVQLADHGMLDSSARALVDENRALVTTLKDVCRWWKSPEFQELMKRQQLYVLCLETDLILAGAGAPEVGFECFCPGAKQQNR